MPELFVTNFNRNFTGVSATAANVIRQQMKHRDLALVGYPLPGCPAPISLTEARKLSRNTGDKPFAIWHVRRNPEMRAGIWARDVLRLPIRLVFTSAAQRRHSAYPRWLISRMDAVIATTPKAAEFVPHVRATVPHGVDTDLFHPSEDREADWRKTGFGGRAGIATIGRIRPEKGTDRFVDAMLRLLPDQPDLTALVLGRATREHQTFLDRLKEKINAAGLSDRLLFPGEIAPENLQALLRSLSLVMQLPRYEGYGMAPLEGMASGVPFIATDTGFYRQFSTNETTGIVVPDEVSERAAQTASTLLNNARQLESMGRIARRIAVEKYSARAEAEGIDAVYNTLWQQA
ncbi:glycosyltransferase [Sulfitobacter sp. BDSS02]|nr:glycosyltransferase [Sulfitobacter sp. BDSS02]MBR9850515.1 glycosyltransferase family 4 protein [Paracoccaceae bacterium]